MPGPAPKDPSTRARTNRTVTAATLRADAAIVAPELPQMDWHPLVLDWWRDLWASPLSPEYLAVDRHGLLRYAAMLNDFWRADSPRERAEIHVRLEAFSKAFGTDPMSRRSLQWTIEKTEEALAAGSARKARTSESARPKGDPRAVLRAL